MLRLTFTAVLTLLLISGCSKNDDPVPEGGVVPAIKTYVVFSPATSDLPAPNDLLFAAEEAADGTMNAGDDASNPVLLGIDYLDGNSTIAPIDITFSAPLNPAQILDASSFILVNGDVIPNPNQNVFLLPLSYPSGDGLLQAKVNNSSVEVPTFVDAIAYQTAIASANSTALMELASPTARAELLSLDGVQFNTVRINPLKPLLPETKYLIVITNVQDWAGNSVYPSIAYDYIRNPESNFGDLGLAPVRDAIHGWEQLANGYFGFMASVFEAAGLPVSTPTHDDIIFSLTFTTGGTTSVLNSVAAPESFFDKSLRTRYKQDAISKLASGIYNVSGDNSSQTSVTDAAINATVHFLLTSPQLPDPDSSPNALYNANIANAIAAGANYETIAADGSAAYIMQRAAAEAAISVHDSGSEQAGDQAPYVDIATEASGTVVALASGAQEPVSSLFPVPSPRESSFYRVDLASAINPALVAPALVYQGQITLPIYQALPSAEDGTNVVASSWQADQKIGAYLDIGADNDMGTTPPSTKITYRYPFPTKAADVPVPVLATLPEPTTLANFGVAKPAEGWPVVIFVHGITAERSTSLPMADALAFACVKADLSGVTGAPCFATIAIDQPLHGIEPSGSIVPGMLSVNDPSNSMESNLPGSPAEGLVERHYNYTSDASANPIAMNYDAEFGSSGSLFINLKHFANSRDSMRQMVLDLLNLNASLATMDVDGDGEANDLDPSRVYLVGHSLGAIDGLTFLSVNNHPTIQNSPFSSLPKIHAASAMFPGGEVTRLLTNSRTFGPVILPALAAASEELAQGRSGLETFLNVFQGVLDSADPINFIASLASQGETGIVISEIVGDGTQAYPSDAVIPNGADTIWGDGNGPLSTVLNDGFVIDGFPAPLVGSEPLINQSGAIKSAELEASDTPMIMVTRYIEGSHRTPVSAGDTTADPDTSAAVFMELIQQAVTLFSLNGVPLGGTIVSNPEVIEP